jgi:preprotein translocase subunit YajC
MDSTLLLALAAAAPAGAPAWTQLLMFVPLLLIFYFLIIRPQQRQMKAHKAKIDAVKRGDQVITGGGLVGKVTKVDDAYVELDLGGAKVRAVKTTLSDVIQPGGAPAND